MSHPSVNARLDVIARSPFHVFYEGPARVVSAANAVGKFDVLPGHTDFFSVMTPGEVVVETDTEPVVFNIFNGIVSVRDDKVMLFVNI